MNHEKYFYTIKMIYKNKNAFGSYLAGLWEGDGSLAVKSQKFPKPIINITFHKQQAFMAETLLRVLTKQCGKKTVGSIFYHPKRNACYFSIHSVVGLTHFTRLVNGKLRSPKAYQLRLVIDWLNEKHRKNIKQLPINKTDLLTDGWLAGFVDADGSFAVRNTIKTQCTKKKLIECQMILVQRATYVKTGESYKILFQQIADALKTKVNMVVAKAGRGSNQYKIKVSSLQSKKILRDYLDIYTLLTSKFLDYQVWCCVDNVMIAKKHYTVQGSFEISKLKKTMNNNRVHFNWDHIIVFYENCA